MKTLNLSEAADVLKVHENRVQEWAAMGIIPGAKIGRAWVFIDEDLFGFVRQQIKTQSASRVSGRSGKSFNASLALDS